MGYSYSEDEEAAIKRMWVEEGLSAAQIARAIGNGVTRNAITGVVHRRGYANTTTQRRTTTRLPTPKDNLVRLIPKAKQVTRTQLMEESQGLELYGPVGDFPPAGCCRYTPHDPQVHMQFCGWPTGNRDKHDNQEGDVTKSWCSVHDVIAHQPKGATGAGVPHNPEADYVSKPKGKQLMFQRGIAAFDMATNHTVDLRDEPAA